MSVTEPSAIEAIFASGPVVDQAMSVEYRFQRKPSGTSDQGRCED